MIEYLVERVQNNYALQVSNIIYYITLLCKLFVQENAVCIDFILFNRSFQIHFWLMQQHLLLLLVSF